MYIFIFNRRDDKCFRFFPFSSDFMGRFFFFALFFHSHLSLIVIISFWKAREKIIEKINKTIKKYRQEGSLEVSNGVLARLLEEESLPDEAVADFIINLIFAGNETTAKTMLFAVYFLTQCPRALKQLLVLHHKYIYIILIHLKSTPLPMCFTIYSQIWQLTMSRMNKTV